MLVTLEPKLPGGTSHRANGGGKLLGTILQPWRLCYGILVFFFVESTELETKVQNQYYTLVPTAR